MFFSEHRLKMTSLRIGKHRIVKNIASLRKVNIAHPYPPTLFSENNVALFSGGPKICNEIHSDWRDPPPFSENSLFLPPQNFRKNRNEIFRIGNDPPPLRKFSENSLNLVGVIVPNYSIFSLSLSLTKVNWGRN